MRTVTRLIEKEVRSAELTEGGFPPGMITGTAAMAEKAWRPEIRKSYDFLFMSVATDSFERVAQSSLVHNGTHVLMQ